MTTIAYRNGVMAGDGLVMGNEVALSKKQRKVRVRDGWILGAAGTSVLCERLLTDFDLSKIPSDPPLTVEERGDKDMSLFAIAVSPDGQIFTSMNDPGWNLLDCEFIAIGSGWEIAMGAMAAGADARRAVQIAIELDSGSGGELTVIRRALSGGKSAGRPRPGVVSGERGGSVIIDLDPSE